eukprot:1038582-Prymnesium_polylepis.1
MRSRMSAMRRRRVASWTRSMQKRRTVGSQKVQSDGRQRREPRYLTGSDVIGLVQQQIGRTCGAAARRRA